MTKVSQHPLELDITMTSPEFFLPASTPDDSKPMTETMVTRITIAYLVKFIFQEKRENVEEIIHRALDEF